jgi:regulator of sirC expression with transglutaminase-like and TPR domain
MSEEFMAARQRARQAFTNLIAGDEASLDLARASLLIAAEEYPSLDIEHYLERLEALASQVRRYLADASEQAFGIPRATDGCIEMLHALNVVLFEHEHFRGSRADYYNPQNSFLNRVLERRLGIPLSLSLVYIEVGKRLGLALAGVGMPFHFIVRCTLPEGTFVYIDPYEKGKLLSEQDCRRRLVQVFKDPADLDAHWLEPLSPKQLLVRMLSNLKQIYLHKNDYQRTLTVSDRILLLNPQHPNEVRDHGLVSFHLKYYSRALRDLNAYLELAPQAEDRQEVKRQINIIRQIIAMMN